VNILSVRNVLHDLSTVVLLPDEEEDFLARVLALRPRFVACAGANPDAVAAVLHKIKWNVEKIRICPEGTAPRHTGRKRSNGS